ncbi:MAG: DMT family transporter, partial [Acetobacteraceae bacterium]
ALSWLAFLVVIWGFSVPAAKLALASIPPFTLTALRYGIAAPCFVVLLWGKKLPSRRTLLVMIGIGVLGIDVGQVTQILGIDRTTASLATVISATIPLFTVIFAALRLGQRLAVQHLLGLAAALLGVGLAALSGPGAFSSAGLLGDALLLGCSVSIALYYVLGTEIAPRAEPVTVAAWSSLAGLPGLIALSAWELRTVPLHPAPVAIGVVLYLGLLTTVAGMWIWLSCLRRLPVRIAASTQYLQPLVGVAASAALFGDPIGPLFGLGTAAVLVGIALASWPAKA